MPPVPDMDKESDSPIHHFINNYHNIVNLYGIPLFFLSSQVTLIRTPTATAFTQVPASVRYYST